MLRPKEAGSAIERPTSGREEPAAARTAPSEQGPPASRRQGEPIARPEEAIARPEEAIARPEEAIARPEEVRNAIERPAAEERTGTGRPVEQEPRPTQGEQAPRPAKVPGAPEEVSQGKRAADAIYDELPEHSVMMDANPKDLVGTRTMYDNARAETPNREVAMYRNTETGEYIVVQGDAREAAVGTGPGGLSESPREGGQAQKWKEILDGRDVGRWELVRHSHPAHEVLPGGERVTPEHARFPSGAEGDMTIAQREATASGRPVKQAIDITTQRGNEVVTYGYDPTQERPYHVTYPGENGTPTTERYKSIEAYSEWYENKFGFTPEAVGPPGAPGERGTQGRPTAEPVAPPRAPGVGAHERDVQGGVSPREGAAPSDREPLLRAPEEEQPRTLADRVADLRRAIEASGARKTDAYHAAAEMQALDRVLATGSPELVEKVLSSLEDKHTTGKGLLQGETVPVTMEEPEAAAALGAALDQPNLEGNREWDRYRGIIDDLYRRQGTANVGRSPRSAARGSVLDTNAMRRDFLAHSLPEGFSDPKQLAELIANRGEAIPAAVEMVGDYLREAIKVSGNSVQGAVDNRLAVWVDRDTGAPTGAGTPGAVLWPADSSGVWEMDHGIELQHGGADDVSNYVPVPGAAHRTKTAGMRQASKVLAGADRD